MYRKLLTVLMTVCLVAALFAGCGGKGGDDPSVSANAGASATDGSGPAAGADAALPGQSQNADGQGGTEQTDRSDESGGSSSTTKSSGGGTSTTKPSGNGSSATKPSGGGSSATKPSGGSTSTTKPSGGGSETNSKAQIVSYFNAAANKVKTGKPGLSYDMGISMIVLEQSMEDGDKGTIKKGTNLNDAFPVAGKTWASQLTAEAVKSATRTLKDGKYTINIVLNTEKGITNINNSSHGKAFTCLDLNDLNDAVEGQDMEIKNVSNTFRDSSITCVVDAKTGNMLSAAYVLNDDISATISSEGFALPATIKLTMNTSYKMTW